jgi:hypothetical protein
MLSQTASRWEVRIMIPGTLQSTAKTDGTIYVAATTHYGPYRQLHQAHDAIRQWCRKNAYSFVSPL